MNVIPLPPARAASSSATMGHRRADLRPTDAARQRSHTLLSAVIEQKIPLQALMAMPPEYAATAPLANVSPTASPRLAPARPLMRPQYSLAANQSPHGSFLASSYPLPMDFSMQDVALSTSPSSMSSSSLRDLTASPPTSLRSEPLSLQQRRAARIGRNRTSPSPTLRDTTPVPSAPPARYCDLVGPSVKRQRREELALPEALQVPVAIDQPLVPLSTSGSDQPLFTNPWSVSRIESNALGLQAYAPKRQPELPETPCGNLRLQLPPLPAMQI